MAYMSQERKKELVARAKPVLKKYGIKGSFGVRNHSTIVCNIKSGKLDFIRNYNILQTSMVHLEWRSEPAKSYMDINPYHFRKHFTGKCKNFFTELFEALNHGNHDRSDITTDYFDVGWYVDVNVGSWNKPYVVE